MADPARRRFGRLRAVAILTLIVSVALPAALAPTGSALADLGTASAGVTGSNPGCQQPTHVPNSGPRDSDHDAHRFLVRGDERPTASQGDLGAADREARQRTSADDLGLRLAVLIGGAITCETTVGAATFDYDPLAVERVGGEEIAASDRGPTKLARTPQTSDSPAAAAQSRSTTPGLFFVAPRTTPNGIGVRLCRSFSAGTEVLMADGTTKPISEIEVGDEVRAVDPETGVAGERTVTGVWPHYDWLLNFEVGGGFVATTEDHHFWNESESEWQETADIDAGDLLLASDGSVVAAGDLDWTSRTYGEAFDLTVEGLHTYFVDFGEGSVLVHNTDCTFAELGGKAAYVDRADLIDGVVEHAAARGRTVLPSQVDDALSTTGTRIRDGLPGRDNAVRFEFEDLIVIINEDTPWESTAFFR